MSDFDYLIEFALSQAPELPIPKRLRIYRAIAATLPDGPDLTRFRHLVAELEAADRRCQEFAFAFTQQTRAASAGSTQS